MRIITRKNLPNLKNEDEMKYLHYECTQMPKKMNEWK